MAPKKPKKSGQPAKKPAHSAEAESKPVFSDPNSDLAPSTPEEQGALDAILEILRKAFRIDFSHYRQTTVLRRLSRRMVLCKQESFAAYCRFLDKNPDETGHLYDDLLLSFTEFFRDPPIFNTLKEKVFPRLVKDRTARTPIRIWVPGCSTGEEVYSLAISLYEFLEQSGSKAPVQFFGTDLVLRHIEKARSGVYSAKVCKSISQDRLERFFDRTPDGCKVTKHIREMCVFAVQDIVQDPPFPKIDLVSCRNVLIYFDAAFQETAIPLFHFALSPGGFLLLGSSETMGRFPELFTPVEPTANLYSKRSTGPKPNYRFPVSPGASRPRNLSEHPPIPEHGKPHCPDIARQIDQVLLNRYAPAGVVVDSSMQIRQFRGHTSKYLEPADGEASLKLSKMAREGLMPDISVAMEQVRKKWETIQKKNVAYKYGDAMYTVDITIIPVADTSEDCFLILFEEPLKVAASAGRLETSSDTDTSPDGAERQRLARELQSTKEHLQAIIEEKDEVNQELWASNEEVQSTNEELQSVNEEMEAAKEELESSNEELLTLNEEMQAKHLELAESKAYLESVFRAAPAGIGVVVNRRFKQINMRICQMTGWSEEELIGQSARMIYPTDEDFEFVGSEKYRRISNYGTGTVETRWMHRNGSIIDVLLSSTPLDPQDLQKGVTFTALDISELKNTERALKESEHKFKSITEHAVDFIFIKNSRREYVFVNRAMQELLGLPQDAILGKTPEEIYGTGQGHIIREIDDRTFAGETVNETQALNIGGNTLFFNTLQTPLARKDGKVASIMGIVRDVTGIIRTEEALRKSEERLLEAEKVARLGNYVFDIGKVRWSSSPELDEIFGIGEDFVRDVSGWLAIIHPDFRELMSNYLQKDILAEHKPFNKVYRIISQKDSREKWVHGLGNLKFGEDGRPIEMFGTIQDISERMEIEEQLRQSEKMQAVGQLAGGIAHDFNNQLTAIQNFAELIKLEGAGCAQISSYVESIETVVERSAGLTSQLLAFSRKGKYQVVDTDINAVTLEVISILQHSIDKKIRIEQRLDADRPFTLGDVSQLQNVILNVGLNARDAIEDDGVITFSSDNRLLTREKIQKESLEIEPGRYIRLCIRDSGRGMDDETKKRMFEPFFTTKPIGKGTGMGLAAVYGTVKNHSGAVEVESAPGAGTSLIIYLPAVENPVQEPRPEAAKSVRGTSAHILFVDDEEMVSLSVDYILKGLGYQVSICKNGAEAVEFYKQHWNSIDLVMLDMIMPVMNGKEAFGEMKKINPDIRALMHSGFSAGEESREAIEMGLKGFIEKPFTMDLLEERISQVLEG